MKANLGNHCLDTGGYPNMPPELVKPRKEWENTGIKPSKDV